MTLLLCAVAAAEPAEAVPAPVTMEVQIVIRIQAEEAAIAAEARHDVRSSIAADSLVSHRLPSNTFNRDGLLLEDEPQVAVAGETLIIQIML